MQEADSQRDGQVDELVVHSIMFTLNLKFIVNITSMHSL